ncbi:MAG: MotA/TolQ/ExbB proton channel family protein [Bdellovibrionota bacterium]
MEFLIEIFTDIRTFLETGGHVLWVILYATFLLWVLIIERYIYLQVGYPKLVNQVTTKWQNRSDLASWHAHRIREAMISEASLELHRFISFIKSLVAVAPMLGLLGTVTGMIAVFDVMALTGTGNARMMASGISMATIPTMAGMVAALSGLYFGNKLEQRAEYETEKLADMLRNEHGDG